MPAARDKLLLTVDTKVDTLAERVAGIEGRLEERTPARKLLAEYGG
jgi:hypothetical protein